MSRDLQGNVVNSGPKYRFFFRASQPIMQTLLTNYNVSDHFMVWNELLDEGVHSISAI